MRITCPGKVFFLVVLLGINNVMKTIKYPYSLLTKGITMDKDTVSQWLICGGIMLIFWYAVGLFYTAIGMYINSNPLWVIFGFLSMLLTNTLVMAHLWWVNEL